MTHFQDDETFGPVDALFIGAHPDDADLLAGGLMASMAKKGRKVILADATAGEFGTRGTVEEREAEGKEAAAILGVHRVCLGLPDGHLSQNLDQATNTVIRAIRKYRPSLVFTHTGDDHHPDHNAIHTATRRAFFLSNVLKIDTGQERFAAKRLFFFWSHRYEVPKKISFIADVTDTYETKINALKAHRSQFANPDYKGPETYVSSDIFWHKIESRAGFFGGLVNVRYGEAYIADGQIRMDDPCDFPDVGPLKAG